MFERFRKVFGSTPQPRSGPPPDAPFEYLIMHGKAVADEMQRASRRAGIVPVLMGTRDAFEQAVELIAMSRAAGPSARSHLCISRSSATGTIAMALESSL
jgi:hypothetical protein